MNEQKQEETKSPARPRMSVAEYRGLFITETPNGECVFHIGKKQYDCIDLNEAIALIDAIYAPVIIKQ